MHTVLNKVESEKWKVKFPRSAPYDIDNKEPTVITAVGLFYEKNYSFGTAGAAFFTGLGLICVPVTIRSSSFVAIMW